MPNYLVCVDESTFSRAAFYTAAFMLDKKKDTLFVATIVEHIAPTSHSYFLPSMQQQVQDKVNRRGKELIKPYLKAADQLGVKNSGILAISNHVGEMICNLVTTRKISTVVMGRRGMNTIKRFFLGSNSKYVCENADCNVLIIKEEWGPSSEHVPRRVTVEMEEKERKERIAENQPSTPQNKFEKDLEMNIVRLAEETERMLREKGEIGDSKKEEDDRFAQHIGVIREEEIERQRRIEEQRQKDDEKHVFEVHKEWF